MKQWIIERISRRFIKHKVYMTDNPDLIIEMAIELKKEREEKLLAQRKIEMLEENITIDKPYTNFGKIIANTSDSITVGQFAKILNNDNIKIGRNRLFKLLRDNGYLINHGKEKNMPKQKYLEQGLFKVSEKISNKSNQEKISTITLITGKGQLYFKERIKNRG